MYINAYLCKTYKLFIYYFKRVIPSHKHIFRDKEKISAFFMTIITLFFKY